MFDLLGVPCCLQEEYGSWKFRGFIRILFKGFTTLSIISPFHYLE